MNKTMFMIFIALLVLGGLTLGLQVFLKRNIIDSAFKQYVWIPFLLIGLAAIFVGFSRDTYLPFLGETVMPCSLLKDSIPENSTHYSMVKVAPGAKVLYWAAEPSNEELDTLHDWRGAYLGFKNAGVVTADNNGIATLHFRKPQPYTVPVSGKLASHIHYRTCANQGLMGRVETIWTFQKHESKQHENAVLEDSNSDSNQPIDIHTNKSDSNTENENDLHKNTLEQFMNEVESETTSELPIFASYTETLSFAPEGADTKREKSTPESTDGMQKDSFMDLASADFVSEEAPRLPTDDNTLYYLASETENSILPMEMNGIDESPQPAGSDYETVFQTSIFQ